MYILLPHNIGTMAPFQDEETEAQGRDCHLTQLEAVT